jgi:hypothetical protein
MNCHPSLRKGTRLKKIDWLLANAANLNPNERGFLPTARNLLQRGQTLSRKQCAWLNEIYLWRTPPALVDVLVVGTIYSER